MKKIVMGGMMLGVLVLVGSRPAEASLFVRISDGLSFVTCDNSTVGGVSACTTAGFTTTLGSNSIKTTAATQTVGDYTLSVDLTGNVPGTPNLAFTLDSKTAVTHNQVTAGHGDLVIDTAGFDFTLPAGPTLLLSASQTANWTSSVITDTAGYQSWGRNDNLPIIPGGNATAVAPLCTSPGGLTKSCASSTVDVPFLRTSNMFAITGRETIHEAVGSVAAYTGTAAVTAPAVPEPASLLLLGTGLIGIAVKGRRRLLSHPPS